MPALEIAGVSGMPVLAEIGRELGHERPLDGFRVLLNLHLTAETATLAEALRLGGASLLFLPSNKTAAPAAVVARFGELGRLCAEPADAADADDGRPLVVVEGNGRIFAESHARPEAWPRLRGISMHTSGGGAKVDGHDPAAIRVPVVAVYRDPLKGTLETGLGTAQSGAAALLHGLHRPLAGRRVLVVGFGNVGSGVARTTRALGAHVRVVEVAPEKRLHANFEGFAAMSLADGLAWAEICVTATGRAGLIGRRELERARAGIVFANMSDQRTEVDVDGCEALGDVDEHTDAWRAGGVRFFRLGRGVQVNHAVVHGNPSDLMDLSFSLHALVVRWLAAEARDAGVYPVPAEIRATVASRYADRLG